MLLRILASAEQDLLDGHEFYESQQESFGAYFLDSLFSDIESLTIFAGIHPLDAGRYRHDCCSDGLQAESGFYQGKVRSLIMKSSKLTLLVFAQPWKY